MRLQTSDTLVWCPCPLTHQGTAAHGGWVGAGRAWGHQLHSLQSLRLLHASVLSAASSASLAGGKAGT